VVDANVLVGEYLAAQPSVTSLLGTNAGGSIYYGYDLPEHFDPNLGPAIQLFRAGGEAHPEITVLIDARLQVRVWAAVEDAQLAAQLYSAIFDVLHGLCQQSLPDGFIMRALEVTGPQEMTDPDTGWVAVFAFYKVMARPGAGSFNGPQGSNVSIGSLTRYSSAASPPTLTPTANPSVWMLSVNFNPNAMVFMNGDLLTPEGDYTTSGNLITFLISVSDTDVLIVMQ